MTKGKIQLYLVKKKLITLIKPKIFKNSDKILQMYNSIKNINSVDKNSAIYFIPINFRTWKNNKNK